MLAALHVQHDLSIVFNRVIRFGQLRLQVSDYSLQFLRLALLYEQRLRGRVQISGQVSHVQLLIQVVDATRFFR